MDRIRRRAQHDLDIYCLIHLFYYLLALPVGLYLPRLCFVFYVLIGSAVAVYTKITIEHALYALYKKNG
jgi:hypothetical protein